MYVQSSQYNIFDHKRRNPVADESIWTGIVRPRFPPFPRRTILILPTGSPNRHGALRHTHNAQHDILP